MKYGRLRASARSLYIDLIRIPHKGEPLIVSPAFGPSTYHANIESITKEEFYNSEEFPHVRFREPLTQESISAAAFEPSITKSDLLDSRWLQLGRIVEGPGGIFTNTMETDETKLKEMLNGATKVNGIYLINDQMAFAPYESFKTRKQEFGVFLEGGLARALEHTDGKIAENLARIASFYPNLADVWGLAGEIEEPRQRVAALSSNWVLGIFGDLFIGVGYTENAGHGGYAYGVMEE